MEVALPMDEEVEVDRDGIFSGDFVEGEDKKF